MKIQTSKLWDKLLIIDQPFRYLELERQLSWNLQSHMSISPSKKKSIKDFRDSNQISKKIGI